MHSAYSGYHVVKLEKTERREWLEKDPENELLIDECEKNVSKCQEPHEVDHGFSPVCSSVWIMDTVRFFVILKMSNGVHSLA